MSGLTGEQGVTQYVLCLCGSCLGSGTWDDDRCPVCAGRGTVPGERGTLRCMTCAGAGRIVKRAACGQADLCPVCGGQGTLRPL